MIGCIWPRSGREPTGGCMWTASERTRSHPTSIWGRKSVGCTLAVPRSGFQNHVSYRWFGGLLDEMRISDIARYDGDTYPLEHPLISDDDTLALYHFDDGDGTELTDDSGNSHHGAIVRGLVGPGKRLAPPIESIFFSTVPCWRAPGGSSNLRGPSCFSGDRRACRIALSPGRRICRQSPY